jgi:hypothetical protein
MAPQARIRDALAHPRMLWVVVLWACLLAAPTLGVGLVGDDLPQAEFLTASREGTTPARWWDMFVLVDGAGEQPLPWWSDPELRVAFFRPLSVVTHQLDHRLWPNHLWAMHLHSVLWYALACGLVWAVARRFCTTPTAAGIAALVYASAFGHLVPVGWLAHRNALVVTVFSLLCILAHDRWRRDGDALAGALAPVALLSSLLAGEAGIVTIAFLLAHAIVFDSAPWLRRVWALAPSVMIVIGWRVLHGALGYGVVGSGAYVDPLGDVQGFLAVFPQRYGSLLALSVSPPFLPEAPPVLWWAATAFLLVAFVLFVVRIPSRAARFGALAVLLGLVPLTSSVPFERLLATTSVGVALVWGELLDAWLSSAARGRRLVALAVVVVHLVVSPAAFVWRGAWLGELHGNAIPDETWLYDEALSNEAFERQTAVVVHTPNYLGIDHLPRSRRSRGLPNPAALWVLHAGAEPPQVTRIDAHTIELRSPHGWPGDPITEFWRSPSWRPFVVGEQIATEDFVATIQAVHDGRATQVRFRFHAPLEDPSLRWATWRAGAHRLLSPSTFEPGI